MTERSLAPAVVQSAETPISVVESSMRVSASGFPDQLRLPFFLTVDDKPYNFDPRKHWAFQRLFSLFESVVLESVEAVISVQPGINNAFILTARPSTDPDDDRFYMFDPYVMHVWGAQYGTTVEHWKMPHPHPFGTELRAPGVGNASPRFLMMMTSATAGSPGFASVLGHLTVRVAGVGVVTAIDLKVLEPSQASPSVAKLTAAKKFVLSPHDDPIGVLSRNDDDGLDVVQDRRGQTSTPDATPSKKK